MRYIYLITAPPHQAVPQRLMDEIDKMIANNQGAMRDGGGFAPQGKAAITRVRGGKLEVLDGPFAETKEVMGGFAMFEFATEAEAIESARQFMELHRLYGEGWEGSCHMYQITA